MLSETIKNGIVMYCPSNRICNPIGLSIRICNPTHDIVRQAQ